MCSIMSGRGSFFVVVIAGLSAIGTISVFMWASFLYWAGASTCMLIDVTMFYRNPCIKTV